MCVKLYLDECATEVFVSWGFCMKRTRRVDTRRIYFAGYPELDIQG